MENFKIDLFEKETGELFPSFQKLNQTDCNICYQHFRKNIKVYDLHESVFDNFQSNGSFIEKYNALDDHFSLSETLFPKIIFPQRNQRAVGQQRIIRQQPVIQTHTALSI